MKPQPARPAPPALALSVTESAPALWQQLQATAAVVAGVRAGRSSTAELAQVDARLRAGVQALSLQVLRSLGLAQALREQLARRPPPPQADALLCTALALQASADPMYASHTLVSQAVEAAKRTPQIAHQAAFINGCLRRFLREQPALLAQAQQGETALWNHPAWWIERLRQDHPQAWQAVLSAGQQRAPIVLRVNERQLPRQR